MKYLNPANNRRSSGSALPTMAGLRCRAAQIFSPSKAFRKNINTTLCFFASVLSTLLFICNGTAQSIPKLKTISPEWVQRGTTTDITLTGENIANISSFAFSGDEEQLTAVIAPVSKPAIGLESTAPNVFSTGPASDDKRVTARLVVASDAALGAHEMRVITAGGASNPLTIRVTDTPEIVETGGHHAVTNAQAVQLPVGIIGMVGVAGQVDFFRFPAKKGERLILDVQANRIGSALDSSLAILDSNGKELHRNEDANGFDSFISFQVPTDGEYIATIRDFEHRGGEDYKYHLTVGAIPYLESIYPFGGQRGKTVDLTLTGINLEGAEKMKVSVDPNAPGGPQEVRARTAKGFSNPRSFDVSQFADFAEIEPNDTIATTNMFSFPGNINGHLQREGDVDFFRFKADKGQRLVFEIYAKRFGSKLDPLLTLTDTNNTVLQRNDDAMGADARFDHTFAEAGEYIISVRDLLGRGGENFGYRLSADPPAGADFSAKLLTDSVRLNRGGRTIARVEVDRSQFGGPVEIIAENLPEGVTCAPLIIPADFPTGLLLFTANDKAVTGTESLELKAVGIIAGKKESRSVQSVSGNKPTTLDKRGRVKKTEGRSVSAAYLTVLKTAPFSIDWQTLAASVEQNQSTKVVADVARRSSFAGEIKISVEGFSAGNEAITKSFEVNSPTLKAADTLAELSMKAKLDSETGARPVYAKAEATVNGQTIVEYSRPMTVRIGEFPFTLDNSLPRLAVTTPAAGSTNAVASEAEFSVKAQRRGLFTDDIQLAVEGLPEGMVATSTNIVRGMGEAGFKLTASEKTKPGTNTVTVVGTAEVNGKKFQLRAPGIQLIVNPPAETETAAAK